MTHTYTRMIRPVVALVAALGLSACASINSVDQNYDFETASRAAPVGAPLSGSVEAAPVAAPNYNVVTVNVDVPRSLRVNEANRYLPSGDIVWREDPMGDRYQQVQAIVKAGLAKGTEGLDGGRDVIADVVLSKFHALTEKARYTVGGVHAIQFTLQFRDAQTGETLMAPKFIRADFDALGGRAAVRAEASGITQKVRITNHLAHVMRQELINPEGFVEYDTGFIGALNQLTTSN